MMEGRVAILRSRRSQALRGTAMCAWRREKQTEHDGNADAHAAGGRRGGGGLLICCLP